MRLELQHQLHSSEGKLRQLQQGIGSGSYVSNGPSTESYDGPSSNLCKYIVEMMGGAIVLK